MAQSRQSILERVAKGEIGAAEAAALLSGKVVTPPPTPVQVQVEPEPKVDAPPKVAQVEPEPILIEEEEVVVKSKGTMLKEENAGIKPSPPKWLRIHVDNIKTGKNQTRITIPLRLVNIGLKIGSGFIPELNNIDWEDTLTALTQGDGGLVIAIEDEDGGDHVQIFVE